MASTEVFLIAETELIGDAGQELVRIHNACARRHGQRFRDLERAVEQAIEAPGECSHQELEPCRFVLTPPAAWLDVIRRASAMGVL